MRKKLAVRIFTIVCGIMLLVTATFAWMLGNAYTVEMNALVLDYTDQYTLDVESQDLSIWVQMLNDEGEYVPFDEAAMSKAVPGEIVPFIVRFHNNTSSVITIDFSINGLTVKDVAQGTVVRDKAGKCLIDYTFMRIVGDANVFQGVSAVETYKCLGDGLVGDPGEEGHSITVLDRLKIPYPESDDDDYILTCYFLIDGEAGPEFQNQALSITSFVAVIQ